MQRSISKVPYNHGASAINLIIPSELWSIKERKIDRLVGHNNIYYMDSFEHAPHHTVPWFNQLNERKIGEGKRILFKYSG